MLGDVRAWLVYLTAKVRIFMGFKIDFEDLKFLGGVVALKGDRRGYELLIKKFDSGFEFPSSLGFERFVGFGGEGGGALNSFCLMRSMNIRFFEKIYLRSSVDLKSFKFFMSNHVEAINKNNIYVPKLLYVSQGGLLSSCYSEYVDVDALNKNECLDLAVLCIYELARLNICASAAEDFFDLKKHVVFTRSYRKTLVFLEEVGGDSLTMCESFRVVSLMPRFSAHGDLGLHNMSAPNIVFDWDCFGYYPPAFDLAIVLIRLGLVVSAESLFFLARKYFSLYGYKVSFEDFYLALLFFCFLFCSNRKVELKKSLYSVLEGVLCGVSSCLNVDFASDAGKQAISA